MLKLWNDNQLQLKFSAKARLKRALVQYYLVALENALTKILCNSVETIRCGLELVVKLLMVASLLLKLRLETQDVAMVHRARDTLSVRLRNAVKVEAVLAHKVYRR